MMSIDLGIILFLLLWLILFGISIAGFIFWLIMLIDAIKREFPKDEDKVVWVLVLIFTNLLGAIVYYFVVKKKDR